MGGFWAVTKHADICRVLTEWQSFTTTVQNVVPPVATTQRRPPLHLDPPGNIPYRNAVLRFLSPRRIEFWRDREFRLHDRRLFTRESEAEAWSNTLLYP